MGGPSFEVTGGFGGPFVWGEVKLLGGCGGGPGIVDGGPGIVGGGAGIVMIGVRGVLSLRLEDRFFTSLNDEEDLATTSGKVGAISGGGRLGGGPGPV